MAEKIEITIYNADGTAKKITVNPDDVKMDDRIRSTLADTYEFVRSQALNRAIGTYTLDHYIVQAQMDIGTRDILNVNDDVVDSRPSKLQSVANLESSFKSLYPAALKKAKAVDKAAEDAGDPPDTAEDF